MRMHKGDQELVRYQNRALIINLLRLNGSLSRTEIAERTGLAPSALTRLTRDLLEEGIVMEIGKSTSKGGRPAVLVSLNPEYGQIIGVKVERARLLAASVNLSGEIRARKDHRFATIPSPHEVVDGIAELAVALADENTLGLGVSISGFVDIESGTDLFTPILGWENVSLRDPLFERLGMPVWVENDVNALALAEKWYGAGRDFRHFLCITVGEGVGLGIVINGEIYRGAFGGAGELGHITIDPSGPVCRCRQRGCLEMYASDIHLAAQAESLGLGSIEGLASAARDGSNPARAVFSEMGRYLGVGAKNVVNLFNPEAIVLGGERMDTSDLFLPAFEEQVCKHSFPAEAARLSILPAALGDDGFLIGSAALVAADFFRVPAKETA